jgi:hypothetical protein
MRSGKVIVVIGICGSKWRANDYLKVRLEQLKKNMKTWIIDKT